MFREAAHMSALRGHPSILQFHEAFPLPELARAVIITELANGTLEQLIRDKEGMFEYALIRKVIWDLIRAVE